MTYKEIKHLGYVRANSGMVKLILAGKLKKADIFTYGFTSGYSQAINDTKEKLLCLMMEEKGMSKTISYIISELEKENKK